ncbi:hypothetical protein Emag_007295 [Eimeria magna]
MPLCLHYVFVHPQCLVRSLDLAPTFASPTLWEGPNFSDFRGCSRESVFAVLTGPAWVMRSGEPCWLVVCSLRDVYREMVYDRAMREIFPRHCLRRFAEIPPRLCPRNMDMEYSYAVALIVLSRSPAYEPLGSLAPSVSSSVALEEERARGSQDDEPDPPSPVMSSPSTPSTSVGGSPPGSSSPREASEALGPLERPRRRRRLEPQSAPSPAATESVEEVQSPSAPANNNSAGGVADSLAGALLSTSH